MLRLLAIIIALEVSLFCASTGIRFPEQKKENCVTYASKFKITFSWDLPDRIYTATFDEQRFELVTKRKGWFDIVKFNSKRDFIVSRQYLKEERHRRIMYSRKSKDGTFVFSHGTIVVRDNSNRIIKYEALNEIGQTVSETFITRWDKEGNPIEAEGNSLMTVSNAREDKYKYEYKVSNGEYVRITHTIDAVKNQRTSTSEVYFNRKGYPVKEIERDSEGRVRTATYHILEEKEVCL